MEGNKKDVKRKMESAPEEVYLNDENPFYRFLHDHRCLQTFLGPFLNILDRIMLKRTCKQLLSLIDGDKGAKKQKQNEKTGLVPYDDTVPLIFLAVKDAWFDLAVSYFPREWREHLLLEERFAIACCKKPKEENQCRSQIELAEFLFCNDIKVPMAAAWACLGNNLSLLKHFAEHFHFPVTHECVDYAFQHEGDGLKDYLFKIVAKDDFGSSMSTKGDPNKIMERIKKYDLKLTNISFKYLADTRNLDVVKALIDQVSFLMPTSTETDREHFHNEIRSLAYRAGKNGCSDIVHYLLNTVHNDVVTSAIKGAIAGGNVDLLKEIFPKYTPNGGSSLIRALWMLSALKSGSVEVVKFLLENRIDYDLSMVRFSSLKLSKPFLDFLATTPSIAEAILTKLFQSDSIETLKWLYETKCTHLMTIEDRQEVLQAHLYNGQSCNPKVSKYVWEIASGFVPDVSCSITKIDADGRIVNPKCLALTASENGNPHALNYFVGRGCRLTEFILSNIILCDDREWIRSVLPWKGDKGSLPVASAAFKGNPRLMVHLVQNGFQVDDQVMKQASKTQDVLPLRWLLANKHVSKEELKSTVESKNKSTEIEDFIRYNLK